MATAEIHICRTAFAVISVVTDDGTYRTDMNDGVVELLVVGTLEVQNNKLIDEMRTIFSQPASSLHELPERLFESPR